MDVTVEEIVAQAGNTTRVVFVSGNFNVLHAGHLRLLRFAAEAGDCIVVGVTPDGTPGVSVPAEMRIEALRSIALNLYPVLLREPVTDFIRRLRPAVVVKGKEHEGRLNPEQAVVDEYGGRLLFSSGEATFSSVSLLRRNSDDHPGLILKPVDYRQRHGFSLSGLGEIVRRFAGLRVLVVGDLIVDEYIACDPLGMSQEDPTIVVTPVDTQSFIGGAGIVAAHAGGLGADVSFVTVVGGDPTADFALAELSAAGVTAVFFTDSTRPTTRKQRFRAAGKTLLRVNHLRQHAVDHDIADAIKRAVLDRLDGVDLLLFADFNYGCLPQPVVDAITAAAVARGIVIAADSQASSQLSDISRFKNTNLVTPTEREARLALRDFESGLPIISERLQQQANAQNVLITLGGEGVLVWARKNGEAGTERLPAFNTNPRDVAGAGDSLFTCTALALCAGADIWTSSYLGSIAAALQVGRIGNTPLTSAELLAEFGTTGA
ncbi:PfkB family carbohydrate kinase (plasmid) [Azospirillum sp. A26]|uniref:PfkB family carbohydrate kinase n=1 Tax=Azospirillum sp. A26 TaxID=3160607 RepID=UPI0036722CC3